MNFLYYQLSCSIFIGPRSGKTEGSHRDAVFSRFSGIYEDVADHPLI